MDTPKTEKRKRDALQGFAYLETFDELAHWSQQDADPLQRSNTPLLPRHALPESMDSSTNAMLIHDYAGGYTDYEACQGAVVAKEQYSCEYLHLVELFVYFSHRLVTIPPPTWINTCHRSGVKVLGTFIVEPGSAQVERILDEVDGSFWVATQLAQIAKAYGFDGWLINIETEFSVLSWSSRKLESFLRQLRRELGDEGKVVWYDALTTVNLVWYQNTFNYLNLPFALAAGSILTNYAWTPELAKFGQDCALHNDLGLENVYFGIDVWAQNVQHGKQKRVTWPRIGGGGTGTGLGVQALKQAGLNAGIFAPGWSFEHFSEHNRTIERAIWDGEKMPKAVICECGPGSLHSSVAYEGHGIGRSVDASPAGSASFMHMDFRRAFTSTSSERTTAHIGAQSVLPQQWTSSPGQHTREQQNDFPINLRIRDDPPRAIASANPSRPESAAGVGRKTQRSTLFFAKTNITADGDNTLRIAYRWLRPGVPGCMAYISAQLKGSERDEHQFFELPRIREMNSVEYKIQQLGNSNIVRVGLSFEIPEESRGLDTITDVLELYTITVVPSAASAIRCAIIDTRLEQRTARAVPHYRLIWALDEDEDTRLGTSLPWSNITGPCSHFLISIDGEEVGRAYALEFVLPQKVAERWELNAMFEVRIQGIGFDGLVLVESRSVLSWSGGRDGEWLMI